MQTSHPNVLLKPWIVFLKTLKSKIPGLAMVAHPIIPATLERVEKMAV
jgi:hypothetical protein